MLPESGRRIEATLDERSAVLDVGGGANPFPRADWVIDIIPYEDRGLYGDPVDPTSKRFGPSTWVSRDICAREPWPFAHKQFDFAVCSHRESDRFPAGFQASLARQQRVQCLWRLFRAALLAQAQVSAIAAPSQLAEAGVASPLITLNPLERVIPQRKATCRVVLPRLRRRHSLPASPPPSARALRKARVIARFFGTPDRIPRPSPSGPAANHPPISTAVPADHSTM
jgi:hypothetical protein